jgi:hypothetical protein
LAQREPHLALRFNQFGIDLLLAAVGKFRRSMNVKENICKSMLVAGAVALLASCGSSDDGDGVNCTTQALAGARIFVVDAAGARIPSPDMTYSYQGGPFLKTTCSTNGSCLVGSAPGTYTLRTSSPGYVSREDVIQAPAPTTCQEPEFTIVLMRL